MLRYDSRMGGGERARAFPLGSTDSLTCTRVARRAGCPSGRREDKAGDHDDSPGRSAPLLPGLRGGAQRSLLNGPLCHDGGGGGGATTPLHTELDAQTESRTDPSAPPPRAEKGGLA
ncbi:hypothetical protein AAFF_G00277900 [Aldrovandia affinis]|uniref:Uncharacterized protein n=1 Tax=Aldrovandia affinis TaxID=143900 RepID=A0AAD7W196_9TELE|nr:hypothetical protein AAFF_G00277900 [Aldrovandia affinis]